MDIFDVFSMNGIVNYPAAGEFFLENVILKVSQTHFSKDFYPKGGHKFFKGGNAPPLGGAVKYPALGPFLRLHRLIGCIPWCKSTEHKEIIHERGLKF